MEIVLSCPYFTLKLLGGSSCLIFLSRWLFLKKKKSYKLILSLLLIFSVVLFPPPKILFFFLRKQAKPVTKTNSHKYKFLLLSFLLSSPVSNMFFVLGQSSLTDPLPLKVNPRHFITSFPLKTDSSFICADYTTHPLFICCKYNQVCGW